MSKCCTHCKETKPYDDFHKNKNTKDGHDTLCRECRITKTQVRTAINKAVVMKAKYKPCHCCGKILDPKDIDLHHIDPSTKEYDVSQKLSSRSTERLLIEIEKCVPVCRPCHREIHRGNRRSS